MIRAIFGPRSNSLKIAWILYAYCMCLWEQTEIIFFTFVKSQNNMISDMPMLVL